MSEYRPDYFHRFRCAASACQENCCIGWEIDIDPESAERYRALSGPFGERLRREIAWEDKPPHFRLRNGRCPFLDRENLCEIYRNCGEKSLCAICAEHPRFYASFGSHRESGLGLCCEAAAALILDTSHPAAFVLEGAPGGDLPAHFLVLFAAREKAFDAAQRPGLSPAGRFAALLAWGAEVQDRLDGQDPLPPEGSGNFPALCAALAELLAGLEPLDLRWPERVRAFPGIPPEILSAAAGIDEAAYGRLLVYFLFRYLLRSAEDGEFLARVKLSVLLTLTVWLLDGETLQRTGTLTPEDRLRNAAACSRELEYSEENLAALEDACLWEEAFSLEEMLCSLPE